MVNKLDEESYFKKKMSQIDFQLDATLLSPI